MKITALSIAILFAFAAGGSPTSARAADRDTTIKQCVSDNQESNQTPETVSSYCSCMAGKMPRSETASVTDWESTHQAEQDACAAGANWKND